eukprot:7937-Heterococcus_DN1.PRE.1
MVDHYNEDDDDDDATMDDNRTVTTSSYGVATSYLRAMHTAVIILRREVHPRSALAPLTVHEWLVLTQAYGIPEHHLEGNKVVPRVIPGGDYSKVLKEKITHEIDFLKVRGQFAFFRDLSITDAHFAVRAMYLSRKILPEANLNILSALDAADETDLSKPDLQRLVRGLKRQRTKNQEQLAEAECAVAMYEKSTYSEIYERAPAHLPLQVVPGATDGASRYEDYSAKLIWEYWRRQPDFLFPQYISVNDPSERRKAYGLRAEELYPSMVTERYEEERQSAYTTYFDKKALTINNEEAVVKHGAHQCFDQMIRVLESRVNIGPDHKYTAIEGLNMSMDGVVLILTHH